MYLELFTIFDWASRVCSIVVYVSCGISIAMQALVRVCDLCLVDIPRWIRRCFFFSGLTFESYGGGHQC